MDNKVGSGSSEESEQNSLVSSPSTEEQNVATKEDLPSITAIEPVDSKQVEPTIRMDAPKWDTVKEVSASELVAKIPDTLKEQLSSALSAPPKDNTPEAPAPDTIQEQSPPKLDAAQAPDTIKEQQSPEKTEEKKAPEPPARPQRPAKLENALTAAVLVIAASVSTWMFARPTTLLFPPTQEQAAQLGQSPDCRRVRFDVSQLLGERWRQTIASCLRGGCDSLREALLARNFPVSTWQLLEEEDEQGCVVNAQGAAKSPECTRLTGRIEGVAKTVLLQVEGECREKP
jgi:hypothetical protein